MAGLRRVESGVYETPDGRYRVERIDSLGESWSNAHGQWVESTSSIWVVTKRPAHEAGEWVEVSQEYDRKREAVAALAARLDREENQA